MVEGNDGPGRPSVLGTHILSVRAPFPPHLRTFR